MMIARAWQSGRLGSRWAAPLLAAPLLAALVLLPAPAPAAQTYPKARVTAGGHTFVVDVAETPETQTLGLGGRQRLGPSDGMLFVYSDKSRYTFWMRGMTIPIDIIWLDNRRIVHIERRVPPPAPGTPEFSLPTYAPGEPANFVLEIAAGRCDELHLKEGDLVAYVFSAAGR
jgi:hypothetical protein